MSQAQDTKLDSQQLENLINAAIKKIGANKENDICRYIPLPTGGYIHHFTMRKMKVEEPEQVKEMLYKYILNVEKPSTVPPKSRAARGSRKRRDQIIFSKSDIERLLYNAKMAGDEDMIRKLRSSQKKDPKAIRRELIVSIRHGKVDHDLWNSYVECMSSNSLTQNQSND